MSDKLEKRELHVEKQLAAMEATREGISLLDAAGVYTYMNNAHASIYGYDPEELIGQTWHKLYRPQEIAQFEQQFMPMLVERGRWQGDVTGTRRDGSLFDVDVSLTALEGGGLICVCRDITERKQAERAMGQLNAELEQRVRERTAQLETKNTKLEQSEQELLRQKALFEAIYRAQPYAVIFADTNRQIAMCNPAFTKIFGYLEEEALGRTPQFFYTSEAVFHEMSRKQFNLTVEQRLEPYEVSYRRKSGEVFRSETVGAAVVDAGGKHLGYLAIIMDVTERKQVEAEREGLIDELEAKNAELERFTYTVSHDLKSPLVTIKGFLGLLEQDVAQGNIDRMRQDVSRIHAATDKMHRLLSELLELSRIGRVIHTPVEISLTELAHEAAQMVAGQIAARGVPVEIDSAMPVVFGDRVRLLEVYQNLLENAVKFMGDQAAPRVQVGARLDGAEVVCYVWDNGVGIDPRYHENVFGLFNRLDHGTEGTGIGLALVKRIVEVHGGRIWIESEGEGHGSTFCFTLPTNASAG